MIRSVLAPMILAVFLPGLSMSNTDYMPKTDANFPLWAQAFSLGITTDPLRFMLTSAIAASIAGTVTNYQATLAIATNEATRTKPTVADKDDARSICETLCRQYAMLIRNNAGIVDADKLAIGVRPINPDRERIDVPTTQPLINIVGQLPGQMTVRYSDSTTPDSPARPFGASELLLFLGVTDTTPATLAQSHFLGKFTRNPIEVEFDETQDKKTATFYARWCSPRGEVGPWSLPISMSIAA